jgi:hypothetical protein
MLKQFGRICWVLLIHLPKNKSTNKKTLLFCFNSALNVAKTAFWREKTAKNVENLLEGWSVASEKQLLVHEYEHEH